MNIYLYKFLKCLPFIKIKGSKSLTYKEMTDILDRIILERKTQWRYNHPSEEFLGVEKSELLKEFERRVWLKSIR